ncbi:MAG: exodeoxyribonuclease VII large subunit [Pseudomonadota bacterium]|nr:exodeoxyribonuclease VII large subunit [Pseudomonadota bacterium]
MRHITLNVDKTTDVYTVSRLNHEVRTLLLGAFPLLWVEGEISNLVRARSGHLYFTLKDEQAQVRCAMFRSRNGLLEFEPEDGLHVLLRARVGLYENRGEYQLGVEHMAPLGSGELHRRFEALKRKLAAAGLFDESHKQPLPMFPHCVAVVTSPAGAAVRDVLSVLRRRFPALPVIVFPTPVQGAGAVDGIISSLRTAEDHGGCDVIILTRGGGSIEDLWSFNDERVANAIHACGVPVVSAVGHEVDFTIADLVADRRAPTPSAAAELVSPDASELLGRIARLGIRLQTIFLSALAHRRLALRQTERRLRREHPQMRLQQHALRTDELERRLAHATDHALRIRFHALARIRAQLATVSPVHRLDVAREVLTGLDQRLRMAIRHLMETIGAELQRKRRTLNAVGPANTLERGYAIVVASDGRIVRTHEDVGADAEVSIRLAREHLGARVTGWRTIPDDEAP